MSATAGQPDLGQLLARAAELLLAQRQAIVGGDTRALEAAHAELDALLRGAPGKAARAATKDPALQRAARRVQALARDNARLIVRARDLTRDLGPQLRPTRLDRSA